MSFRFGIVRRSGTLSFILLRRLLMSLFIQQRFYIDLAPDELVLWSFRGNYNTGATTGECIGFNLARLCEDYFLSIEGMEFYREGVLVDRFINDPVDFYFDSKRFTGDELILDFTIDKANVNPLVEVERLISKEHFVFKDEAVTWHRTMNHTRPRLGVSSCPSIYLCTGKKQRLTKDEALLMYPESARLLTREYEGHICSINGWGG
jgi:hypothetical protein